MNTTRQNDILTRRVANRLKEIRYDRKLTQENVRFDLDINIGRIEASLHTVSLPTLARLCDYYKITFEEFFHGIPTK